MPPPPDKAEFIEQAQTLGFEVCGFAPVEPPPHTDYYNTWIEEGKHAGMQWMERNLDRRLAPKNVLKGARTIIILGLNYYQEPPPQRGVIARYAMGKDYHKFIYKRLKTLCKTLSEYGGDQKPYVDTGPVLEKVIAAQTRLGWQGKHTVTLNTKLGPWLLLGTIFTTLEFEPDEPVKDHCGHCTRCLDACPTGAITAPYQLDARRCIAYLTIEHHGSIPEEFRALIGDRLFGCDICLEVCPWNRKAQQTREIKLAGLKLPDLTEMLKWNEVDMHAHCAGTPLNRLGLSRLKRNICVVLGNVGSSEDLRALRTVSSSADTLAAEHAQWAIEQINTRAIG